jgi:hypothetical protein
MPKKIQRTQLACSRGGCDRSQSIIKGHTTSNIVEEPLRCISLNGVQLERSASSNELDDQHDDSDDKQQVDETSGDMEAKSQNP